MRGSLTFTCICSPEFMGPVCQLDVNRCRSNPCIHNGICINGVNGFSCDCAGTGYSGTICNIVDLSNSACPPGSEKLSAEASCTPCEPGTFGASGKCIGCQKGTYSNEPAAFSPSACQVCPKGSFSDQTHATTCSPCTNGGCSEVAGSFSSSQFPSLISAIHFTMVTFDSDGKIIEIAEKDNFFGYYYLGIFLGLVFISGVLVTVFRKKFRKFVAPVAIVLKTPFSYMQILMPSGMVTEVPSFFRGLVGIWVILGLLLVTMYQIHIFVTERITEISALQPGTVFTNGTATSTSSSGFRLSVEIYSSPITCDSSDYDFSLSVTNILPRGSATVPVKCSYDSSKMSVNLTSSSLALLSFTPDSMITLQVTSRDGTYLFNHGVSYELLMDSFDSRVGVMTETLVPVNSSLVGGDVQVDLSLTPTELVTDTETLSHGYSYSQFSSVLEISSFPSSDALKVAFKIPVSQSLYFQVKKTESINGLQFVVGLLALASGVITAGSLGANVISHVHRKWTGKEMEGDGDVGMEVPEGKMSTEGGQIF